MTITKYQIFIVSLLFSSWFFVDSYFAHADDVQSMRLNNQVKDWSMEQSLNFMQQKQVKSEIRKEVRRPVRDIMEIEDLKETYKVLKARGAHLQKLQDNIKVNQLAPSDEPKTSPISLIKDLL